MKVIVLLLPWEKCAAQLHLDEDLGIEYFRRRVERSSEVYMSYSQSQTQEVTAHTPESADTDG